MYWRSICALMVLGAAMVSAFIIPNPGKVQHGKNMLCANSRRHATIGSLNAFITLLKAASNDDDGSSSDGAKKKRRRKAPLPTELLQEGEISDTGVDKVKDDVSISNMASSQSRENDLEERLRQDIARFRKKEEETKVQEEEATGIAAVAGKAASAFEKILVADFFVVLGFLGWFITGVVFKSVFDDRSVLDSFNKLWDFVIQPALGILMAGTLGVGVINNIAKRTEETSKS